MFTIVAVMVAQDADADRHFWDIPVTKFENVALFVWLGEFSYLVCSCLVRISVLLVYRRLVLGTHSKVWFWAILGAIVFTAAWSLAFILALFLNCSPFEAYWKAFSPTYKQDFSCTDTSVVNALSGVFAITGDLYAVALPFALTWNMQMPWRRKAALNAIFSLGLVVVAASSVRTYYTIQVATVPDVSTAIFNVFVWSQVELQLAFMCASAPALRVFFRRYLSTTFSRSGVQEGNTASGSGGSRPKSLTIVHKGGSNVHRPEMGSKMYQLNSVTEEEDDVTPWAGTGRFIASGEGPWPLHDRNAHSVGVKEPVESMQRSWSSGQGSRQEHEYEMQDMEKGDRGMRSQHSHRNDETWYEGDGTSSKSVV